MDPKERPENQSVTIDKDAQINVVVNRPADDEDTIDLGRVFHNMKVKSRIYAWVLILCMLVGFCAPLVRSGTAGAGGIGLAWEPWINAPPAAT